MTRAIQDQVVVITGASSGLGREAALAFARAGARVVLAARNDIALETLATEIRRLGRRALVVPTDVTRFEEVQHLARQAVEHFGRIDTWVNNAGVSLYASVEEADLRAMRQVVDVILWGNIHGVKAALPHMKEQGGVIICVASALADFSVPLQSAYCAAKHALKGFYESLRIELEHDKSPLKVSVLKPPSIDTPLFRHARTHLGVQPKPLPPTYDPGVIAREILRAATAPRREVTIGGAAQAMGVFHAIAPGLFEKQQARSGYEQQKTQRPKPVEAPDNLFHPLEEPGDIRDTGNGWRVSWVMWLEEHPKTALAGLTAAAALALAARRR